MDPTERKRFNRRVKREVKSGWIEATAAQNYFIKKRRVAVEATAKKHFKPFKAEGSPCTVQQFEPFKGSVALDSSTPSTVRAVNPQKDEPAAQMQASFNTMLAAMNPLMFPMYNPHMYNPLLRQPASMGVGPILQQPQHAPVLAAAPITPPMAAPNSEIDELFQQHRAAKNAHRSRSPLRAEGGKKRNDAAVFPNSGYPPPNKKTVRILSVSEKRCWNNSALNRPAATMPEPDESKGAVEATAKSSFKPFKGEGRFGSLGVAMDSSTPSTVLQKEKIPDPIQITEEEVQAMFDDGSFRKPEKPWWNGNNIWDVCQGTHVLWKSVPTGKRGGESTKVEYFNGLCHGWQNNDYLLIS